MFIVKDVCVDANGNEIEAGSIVVTSGKQYDPTKIYVTMLQLVPTKEKVFKVDRRDSQGASNLTPFNLEETLKYAKGSRYWKERALVAESLNASLKVKINVLERDKLFIETEFDEAVLKMDEKFKSLQSLIKNLEEEVETLKLEKANLEAEKLVKANLEAEKLETAESLEFEYEGEYESISGEDESISGEDESIIVSLPVLKKKCICLQQCEGMNLIIDFPVFPDGIEPYTEEWYSLSYLLAPIHAELESVLMEFGATYCFDEYGSYVVIFNCRNQVKNFNDYYGNRVGITDDNYGVMHYTYYGLI